MDIKFRKVEGENVDGPPGFEAKFGFQDLDDADGKQVAELASFLKKNFKDFVIAIYEQLNYEIDVDAEGNFSRSRQWKSFDRYTAHFSVFELADVAMLKLRFPDYFSEDEYVN
ncbi:hypothetical protein [Acidovorax sp.]|uniref:hypothetical protein n=1 Tax=Acidovorax sp. TaxID=1872122 RepID=UPI00391F52BF